MATSIEYGKPTGSRRYRKSFFGKMILQLQFECKVIECYGGPVDIQHGKIWRDATIEDLTRYTEGDKT
jgi:hypothetical protein